MKSGGLQLSAWPKGAFSDNGCPVRLGDAPVAQLDRALPSEGKGHTFESCRVRHLFQGLSGPKRLSRNQSVTPVSQETDELWRLSVSVATVGKCRFAAKDTLRSPVLS